MSNILIAIEGNIGTNINKFINFLQKHYNIPSDSCIQTKELHKLTLRNPKRWAFTTLIKEILDKYNHIKKKSLFIKRSPLFEFNYLFQSYYELKYITYDEFTILKEMINTINFPVCKGFIYIKSSPNLCYEQLIEQNKPYNFEYINDLHNKYELFISKLQYPLLVLELSDILYTKNNEILQDKILMQIEKYFPHFKNLKKKEKNEKHQWTIVKKTKKK